MSMTPERWQHIKVVLQEALELPVQQRSAFLAEVCSNDPSLRQEVESFLALDEQEVPSGMPEPVAGRVALPPGTRLGDYQVQSLLGMGGMGEVYRAHDPRLRRDVAIKVLPRAVSNDPERLRRFEQEAQTAAALNHPNIVAIFQMGIYGGASYLVSELLDGGTLREQLLRGPVPVRKAIDYSVQIARGLAAAHEKGVVHRDLKPENIFITNDGRAKILDFGLAKLMQLHSAFDGSIGKATGGTQPGVVMGTVGYMSPEQVSGNPADHRTDIFALGAIMYETVTGKRAFQKPTAAETMTAILSEDPPSVSQFAPTIIPALQGVVHRCLEKDPEQRFQSASDVAFALESLSDSGSTSAFGMAQVSARNLYWPTVAAIILIVVALTVVTKLWLTRQGKASDNSTWLQMTDLPDVVSEPALSPDGRMLTFIRGGSFAAAGQIYIKMLPNGEPVQLTHDHSQKMSPAFSPDGTQIAYTVVTGDNHYDTWAVPLLTGQPHLWLPNASGLVWSGGGKILFSEIRNNDVHMAIESADQSRAAQRDLYIPAGDRAMAHRSYASPDGKWVLIAEMDRGVWLPCRLVPMDGSSAGRPVGPPTAACTFAAWSPDGKWMYLNSNAGGTFHIWRQRFPGGEPQQITSGLTEEEGIAMAADGRSLITAVGISHSSVWIHDPNRERQVSLEGYSYDPEFTPDGKRLCYRISKAAVAVGGFQPSELRLVEINSGINESLLPGLAVVGFPGHAYDVSPDGKLVVVAVPNEGTRRIWLAPLDLHSPPRQIPNIEGDNPLFASNNEILFRAIDRSAAFVYSVRTDGTELRKVIEAPIATLEGISPGGQWLVVRLPGASGASATAFPLTGGSPVRITAPGSSRDHSLKWSPDGRWLFVAVLERNLVHAQTYPLQLPRGRLLPQAPAGGFTVEADMMRTSGALTIPGYAVPSPTPGTYAFVRVNAQRNIFRVPLP
jgi:serine/threonine protein kinase